MTAYLLLYVIAGPWPGGPFPATGYRLLPAPDPVGLVFAGFLAWRIIRGGSLARDLVIVYTAIGILLLLSSPGLRSGSRISLGLLAIYVVQIALLVSTPIYMRTRK